MEITKDKSGQAMIEWQQSEYGWKRAWVQVRTDPDKDYAHTRRYLNVARVSSPGEGPGGNATDFPIFSKDLSDEQILYAFVSSVNAITGCKID